MPVGARTRLNILVVAEEGAGLALLQMLERSGHHVAMVLTSPPQGAESAIWRHAAARGHRLLPAALVRDPAFAAEVRRADIDLLLNAHSLHLIRGPILESPRLGAYNLHPGPLPRYAGLNAPSWAIHRGEPGHGVTVHRMLAGIDTGPIAYQAMFDLHQEETGLSLSLRCTREGLPLMAKLIDTAAADPSAIPRVDQDLSKREYFGREIPEGGVISWSRPAAEVHRFLRASSYHPFPSPWGHPRTTLAGRALSIVAGSPTGAPANVPPGTVAPGAGATVQVACGDAWLEVSFMKVGGRRVRPSEALRRGDRLGT
jgi:methionyl-tRNA formyltransferase